MTAPNNQLSISFASGKTFTLQHENAQDFSLLPGESKYEIIDLAEHIRDSEDVSMKDFEYGYSELHWQIHFSDNSIAKTNYLLYKQDTTPTSNHEAEDRATYYGNFLRFHIATVKKMTLIPDSQIHITGAKMKRSDANVFILYNASGNEINLKIYDEESNLKLDKTLLSPQAYWENVLQESQAIIDNAEYQIENPHIFSEQYEIGEPSDEKTQLLRYLEQYGVWKATITKYEAELLRERAKESLGMEFNPSIPLPQQLSP